MSAPWPRWYRPPTRPAFTAETLGAIAEDMGLTVAQVRGESKRIAFVHARAVYAHVMFSRGVGLSQIGRNLGDRDHNTIANLVDRVPVYLKQSPKLHGVLDRAMLRSGC